MIQHPGVDLPKFMMELTGLVHPRFKESNYTTQMLIKVPGDLWVDTDNPNNYICIQVL